MSVFITPTDAVRPTEFRCGAVNIRLRHAAETTPDGTTHPAGSIFAVVVLSGYRDGKHISDLPPVVVSDVAAWIAATAAGGDNLAAVAAADFAGADERIKRVAAIRGSQLGLCERPV